jgi:WD40 repeat protein
MSDDTIVDALLSQWQSRQAAGEEVPVTDLCGERPDLIEEVERRVSAIRRMQRLAQTLDPLATSIGATPDLADAPPQTIGGYEILGELGRGGMGVVYKARQTSLKRLVALKMIHAGNHTSAELRDRFRGEAEVVARLKHPNIVEIHEVGEAEGRPYFSLEFVEGGTLDRKLAGTPMPPAQAAELMEVLARAVHHAHVHGIVHRDLKPGNVLLTLAGQPKISDFGLAKQLQSDTRVTQTGSVIGTPSYMAPEQAAGRLNEIGPRTDVYALGATLYEMLTGRPPFRGTSVLDTLEQVRHVEPAGPRRLQPNVPRDLETICLKCLRKEPAQRYESALELAEDLRRFRAGESVQARPVGTVERGLKWARRHPAAATAYTLLVLVLVLGGLGGAATWLWHNSEQARLRLEDEQRLTDAARKETASALARLGEISNLQRVGLAHWEWQNGGVARALQLLESCLPEARQAWEWRYVNRLCHSELRSLQGIRNAALSPDGAQCADVTDDYSIRVWNVNTGEQICVCRGHQKWPVLRNFSPDSLRLASAAEDGTIRIWDTQSGRQVLRIPHDSEVRDLAFSHDGKRLATAPRTGNVRLWDAHTGREVPAFKASTQSIGSLAFSPDGKLLAGVMYATLNPGIKVWDAETGQELRFIRRTDTSARLAFSPDGRRLAGACADKTVTLWDAFTGEPVLLLRGHTNQVMSVAYSPDGRLIASSSVDATTRVWDAASGEELATHRSGAGVIGFNRDGKRLVTCLTDAVKIWNSTADARAVLLAGHSGQISEVRVSSDRQHIASTATDGTLRIWDAVSMTEVRCIAAHKRSADSVAFSPDGKQIVSGGHDELVKVWDRTTGQELRALAGHTAPVQSVAWSPDGTYFASAAYRYDAGNDLYPTETKVWDAVTGQERCALQGASGCNCVAFSPDGKLLAGGGDRDVIVWRVASGERQLAFAAHNESIVGIAFSPNGHTLATASFDHTVKVWEAETGKHLLTFPGHTERVTSLAFSPDGTRIASGGDDNTVRIIVAATGDEALSLKGTVGPVHSLAFSPDGHFLVSGGRDRVLRVWDARPQ